MFHYGLRLLVLKIRINSVKSFNLHHQWKARFEKCRFTHLCPCQTWAKENSEQENSARFHFKVSALPREMESNLTGLKRVEFKPSKNWQSRLDLQRPGLHHQKFKKATQNFYKRRGALWQCCAAWNDQGLQRAAGEGCDEGATGRFVANGSERFFVLGRYTGVS